MDLFNIDKMREKKALKEQEEYRGKIAGLAADVMDLLNQKGTKLQDVGNVCAIIQQTVQNYLNKIVKETSLDDLKK